MILGKFLVNQEYALHMNFAILKNQQTDCTTFVSLYHIMRTVAAAAATN